MNYVKLSKYASFLKFPFFFELEREEKRNHLEFDGY